VSLFLKLMVTEYWVRKS